MKENCQQKNCQQRNCQQGNCQQRNFLTELGLHDICARRSTHWETILRPSQIFGCLLKEFTYIWPLFGHTQWTTSGHHNMDLITLPYLHLEDLNFDIK